MDFWPRYLPQYQACQILFSKLGDPPPLRILHCKFFTPPPIFSCLSPPWFVPAFIVSGLSFAALLLVRLSFFFFLRFSWLVTGRLDLVITLYRLGLSRIFTATPVLDTGHTSAFGPLRLNGASSSFPGPFGIFCLPEVFPLLSIRKAFFFGHGVSFICAL